MVASLYMANGMTPLPTRVAARYLEAVYTDYQGYTHRGIVLTNVPGPVANEIRRALNYKERPGDRSAEALSKLLLNKYMRGALGESWTADMRVAKSFAQVWSAKNRGKKLHIILSAKPPKTAYDPALSGEELPMFSDESENRIPSGTAIGVERIAIYTGDSVPSHLHYGRPLKVRT